MKSEGARRREETSEVRIAQSLPFASCLFSSQLLLLLHRPCHPSPPPPLSSLLLLLRRLLLPLKSLFHRVRDSGFPEFEKLVPRLFADSTDEAQQIIDEGQTFVVSLSFVS